MIDVRSSVDGAIQQILVQRGDNVRKGQLLVLLDTTAETGAAAVAKARLEAEGTLRAAQAQLDFAIKKLARVKSLVGENAMSQADLEQAEAEADVARAQMRTAEGTHDVAKGELVQAEALISQKRLRSPVDGVVVDRFQNVGEIASRGSKQPILRVAQVDPLNVEIVRPVADFGSIKRGMLAEIEPEQPAGQSIQARVEIVDTIIDAPSGTFGVRLVLPNPRHEIPAGVKCHARFLEN